jgi:hypothetical protein
MVWNEGGWTRIYRQDSRAGFFSEGQTDLNRANPAATNYAILSDLEHFRRDGRFELAMFWPGSSWTAPHRWTQTSNPVTTAAGATPTGCTALEISYTVNGWGCLQRSFTGQHSLLDGTINPQSNWYYAVGTTYCWGSASTGCQPGPDGGVHVAELWVR